MSLAILGIGTALPHTPVSQTEAMNIARTVCCRTDAHETWIPSLYAQSGIEWRHMAFPQDVLDDLIQNTTHSGSERCRARTSLLASAVRIMQLSYPHWRLAPEGVRL